MYVLWAQISVEDPDPDLSGKILEGAMAMQTFPASDKN
jgi:hypothetical protein